MHKCRKNMQKTVSAAVVIFSTKIEEIYSKALSILALKNSKNPYSREK